MASALLDAYCVRVGKKKSEVLRALIEARIWRKPSGKPESIEVDRLHLIVTNVTKQRLDDYCAIAGVTISDLVREEVAALLAKEARHDRSPKPQPESADGSHHQSRDGDVKAESAPR